MSEKISKEQYKRAMREMMTGMGISMPVRRLIVYLEDLRRLHKDDFDPIRALDDLKEYIEIYKKELRK